MNDRARIIRPFEDREPAPSRSRRTSKPRRRGRWLLMLAGLLAFVFFLPNLLGMTGLHQPLVNFLASDLRGRIEIEKASLGWLQPIRLTGVAAYDLDGGELFKAEEVVSSKSIVALLKMDDFGQFDLRQPTFYLHLRPDGSNIEDALASFINSSEPAQSHSNSTATSMPAFLVNVVDGRALVTSETDIQSWQLNQVQGHVQSNTEVAPLVINVDAEITPMHIDSQGQVTLKQPGRLNISTNIDPGGRALELAVIDLAMQGEQAPLSVAAPILQRFIGENQAEGLLTGQMQARADTLSSSIAMDITQLNIDGLSLVAPGLIGRDRFSVANVKASGSFEASPLTIASKNFELATDFGRVKANGRFDFDQINRLASDGMLVQTPFQMDGVIDLPGLVQKFPDTLKLHQDLQVKSGTLQFHANSRTQAGVTRMVVNMDTANFTAERNGQNIAWQKPVRLVGTIVQSENGLSVEDLLCEADFLTVAGTGNPTSGSFRAKGDLDQLTQRLGQFVDLQGTQMAGKIDGSFGWQTAEAGPTANGELPMQIGGSFVVQNPVVKLPSVPIWQPEELSVKLSAAGSTRVESGNNVLALTQGGIQVDVGSEQAVATLAQPIRNLSTDPWVLQCEAKGDLPRWIRHIENFVELGDFETTGNLNLTCTALVNSQAIQLGDVNYQVAAFGFEGYGMRIEDPQVEGSGALVYDFQSGQVTIPDTVLVSRSIAARGQNLAIVTGSEYAVDGVIAFQGDCNRIADWFGIQEAEDSIHWYGKVEGNLRFDPAAPGIGGQVEATLTDLIAAQRAVRTVPASPNEITSVSNQTEWIELLREPTATLASELVLARSLDAIQFRTFQLDSSSFKLNASGSMEDLFATMHMRLAGNWNPNWQKVNSLIGAYSGNLVQLAGSGQQPFQISGPLFSSPQVTSETPNPLAESAWLPQSLEATTSIRWDQGSLASVPIGASQIEINLRNSFASFRTDGIPITGGLIRLSPGIDMRGENPILVMDQTRVIDNVALSPETARQWLRYVAPLVADATSAQGKFTVDARSVRMPLYDPMAIEARGAIRLDNVVIGAGPLAQQLLGTVKQVRAILKPDARNDRDLNTWLQMSQQTIPIVIQDQKVFHENLTLTSKDIQIKTRGSVGFDQSLNLIAEIPIADDWIANEPYLSGLRGQSISIPISGTVSKPKLDSSAITKLSSQLVKQAAGGAVQQAIGEKLNPQINQLQNEFNNKLNRELESFRGKVNDTLGGSLLPGSGGTSGNSTNPVIPAKTGDSPSGNPTQPNLQNQLEQELIKGIGNLFGGDKSGGR